MRVWANMHMSFCRDWNKRCKPDIGKIILKCKTEKLIEKEKLNKKDKTNEKKKSKKEYGQTKTGRRKRETKVRKIESE